MIILVALAQFLISIMDFIEYVLMGYIILGWFIFFGAVKNRAGFFFKLYVFLMTKIEPILSRIRRFLPSVAGFDFSPLFIFVALHFSKLIVIKLFNVILNAIYG